MTLFKLTISGTESYEFTPATDQDILDAANEILDLANDVTAAHIQEQVALRNPLEVAFVCDGGCLGNGKSTAITYGSVARVDPSSLLAIGVISRYPWGFGTNQLAECKAMLEAMKQADSVAPNGPVAIYTDSQWVINEATEVWQCTKPHLMQSVTIMRNYMRNHKKWHLEHLPRDIVESILGH
jgi:ribonuclease HI